MQSQSAGHSLLQFHSAVNENDWQSRCLARMVCLRPSIATPQAGMLVTKASALGSFRGMTPEDAAERLISGTDKLAV